MGRLLEKVRGEIEPLPRISKYGALFKSERQKDQFLQWATRKGWSKKEQSSLWLKEWRKEQWRRRHNSRLSVGPEAWGAWFALADSGAVDCGDSPYDWESDDISAEENFNINGNLHQFLVKGFGAL